MKGTGHRYLKSNPWNQGEVIYNFVHTLLPTTLPLKGFYQEYYFLYRRASSLGQQIAFMKKYSRKEILPTTIKAFRLYGQLQRTYLDYGQNPLRD